MLSVYNKEITRKSAKQSGKKIINIVLDYYNVDMPFVLQDTNRREVVQIRHTCMYLLRRCHKDQLSQQWIADLFHRERSNVNHAQTSISNLIQTDEVVKGEIKDLLDLIFKYNEDQLPKAKGQYRPLPVLPAE